jgi:hypothetical protein
MWEKGRKGMLGRCRLCESEGDLRHSHIFPEFLYEHLYDEKHRSVGVKPYSGAKQDILQKGLREYLLCGPCENRLSKYERYGAKILRGLPDVSSEKPGAVVFVRKVDYCKFKLFEMSLLWRAGIAKQPSFADVRLGPHESRLRKMLLGSDPGKPWEYSCVLIRFPSPGTIDQILTFPRPFRFLGHYVYLVILWGMIWMFFVSSDSYKIKQQRSFLSEAGDLPLHVATESGKEFIRGWGKNARRLGLI